MPEREWERRRPAPVTLPRPSRIIDDPKRVFGEVEALGATYTLIVQAAAQNWMLDLRLVNRTTSYIRVRLYRADNSWAAGEPTGGTLKAAWAYDLPIRPGGVYHIDELLLLAGEKLVAYSDTASSLDMNVQGRIVIA